MFSESEYKGIREQKYADHLLGCFSWLASLVPVGVICGRVRYGFSQKRRGVMPVIEGPVVRSAKRVSENGHYVNLQITIILNELACLYKRSGDYKEKCVCPLEIVLALMREHSPLIPLPSPLFHIFE